MTTYSQDRINPKTGEHWEGDYTGFASNELKRYFASKLPRDVSIEKIATRIGMNQGDLRRLVVKPNVEFVGLGMTDRILLRGLGIDVCDAIKDGDLHIIPNSLLKHARWLAEDEFWANDKEPSMVELMVRMGELIKLRRRVLEEAQEL